MKKISSFMIGAVCIILIFVLANSVYIAEYRYSVLIKQFDRIIGTTVEPGIYFKLPFIQSTQSVYAGKRIYDIPASDVITRDKKSMIADNYVLWTVTDPVKYYQTLGAIAARAEERIDAAVYNATKNTISSMTQEEVIAARGTELTQMITLASNSDISGYGISVVIAEIKALDLPDDNKEAVYARMISERQNIAASYEAKGKADAQKIINETDRTAAVTLANARKDAESIIAEGEAEYMRILSEAYNDPEKADFYHFTRSLDALRESMKGDKTLILDKDSEIARLLYQ